MIILMVKICCLWCPAIENENAEYTYHSALHCGKDSPSWKDTLSVGYLEKKW